MEKFKIERINYLSKKAKSQGLTPEEETEQQKLREEYIKAFRGNLKSTLDSIVIKDKDGNLVKLNERKRSN